MKKLYTARDSLEAHFVRTLLESEGIRVSVLGDILGMARGDLPMTQETLPAVWVNEGEIEPALAILATYRKQKPDDTDEAAHPEPWQCPSCNETIEGQFALCWNCQAERPNINISQTE